MKMTKYLHVGDIVEVRSLKEILDTLDSTGTLEGMPFMPEMSKYCGKRFRVAKRAHKTCNTVDNTGGARVQGAIHLEEVRCDGSGHGGCQASCLMFWKEAWLKPLRDGAQSTESLQQTPIGPNSIPKEWSYRVDPQSGQDRVRYRCQITEIPNFTKRLPWWDVRQYIEDITSGNVFLGQLLRGIRFSLFRAWMYHGFGYRIIRAIHYWFQRRLDWNGFPFETGTLQKTPHLELHLQPGEWVRVKSFEEIKVTLDTSSKNRGLGFDTSEMRLHCKKIFRVKARINRIINEKTGEMMNFSNPCITLEGVYCTGETTQTRLFCPRAIIPYWREIWLERISSLGEEPR